LTRCPNERPHKAFHTSSSLTVVGRLPRLPKRQKCRRDDSCGSRPLNFSHSLYGEYDCDRPGAGLSSTWSGFRTCANRGRSARRRQYRAVHHAVSKRPDGRHGRRAGATSAIARAQAADARRTQADPTAADSSKISIYLTSPRSKRSPLWPATAVSNLWRKRY
jgi:hypothetical protein